MRGWLIGIAGLVATCIAIAGCALDGDASSSDENAVRLGTPPGAGLPCDVAEVLERNCGTCHSAPPIYGAPMPLVTWEQLQAPSSFNPNKKVFEAVTKRIHSTTRPMPPSGPMNAADLAVIDSWIAAGTPRNNVACVAPDAGADSGADGGGLGCTPDQVLVPPTKWTAAADVNDEYVCYGIDVTNDMKRHAIAIAPIVDNKIILHHMDLFQAPESYGKAPQACSPFANGSWRMMFAWAPGGSNMILPAEAGFPLEGTTHYVVQIHYANPAHALDQKDGSGFGLCTTDKLRANDADVMAFGSEQFTVPARSNYALTCSSPSPSATEDIHVFGMMPHLHNLGTSLATSVDRASGESELLAEQTHWDINNQAWFGLDATVKPGDKIRTRCTWQNDTDTSVSFGDSAADEMCYAFTMYYPRITRPDWHWALPSKTASCVGPTPPPDEGATH